MMLPQTIRLATYDAVFTGLLQGNTELPPMEKLRLYVKFVIPFTQFLLCKLKLHNYDHLLNDVLDDVTE